MLEKGIANNFCLKSYFEFWFFDHEKSNLKKSNFQKTANSETQLFWPFSIAFYPKARV